jgi:hypothetical protein
VKKRVLILNALLSAVSFVFFVSVVYADPVPYVPPGPPLVELVAEVVVSEAVAWIIGGEFLFRLLRRTKQGVSRLDSYAIMLVAMTVSLVIGLFFWRFFGWI